MALSDFLNRKRPPLDGGSDEGVSPLSGDLAGNEAVRRKQRLLLASAAGPKMQRKTATAKGKA